MLQPKVAARAGAQARPLPVLTSALVLLATACPPPRATPPPLEGLTAQGALLRLEAAEAKVVRVRGEAKLKVDAKEGKHVVTLFIAAAAPGKVHLEQLDFFGRPQAQLASDGERFTLFDGQKGQWYRGPATAAALSRFFPVSLSPQELAALLLGKAPRGEPGAPLGSAQLSLGTQGKRHLLTVTQGATTDALLLASETGRVEHAARQGPAPLELEFDEWTKEGEAVAPRRIQLKRGDGTLTLELVWKDLELNGPEDASLFTLELPQGVTATELDAAGNPRGPEGARAR